MTVANCSFIIAFGNSKYPSHNQTNEIFVIDTISNTTISLGRYDYETYGEPNSLVMNNEDSEFYLSTNTYLLVYSFYQRKSSEFEVVINRQFKYAEYFQLQYIVFDYFSKRLFGITLTSKGVVEYNYKTGGIQRFILNNTIVSLFVSATVLPVNNGETRYKTESMMILCAMMIKGGYFCIHIKLDSNEQESNTLEGQYVNGEVSGNNKEVNVLFLTEYKTLNIWDLSKSGGVPFKTYPNSPESMILNYMAFDKDHVYFGAEHSLIRLNLATSVYSVFGPNKIFLSAFGTLFQ